MFELYQTQFSSNTSELRTNRPVLTSCHPHVSIIVNIVIKSSSRVGASGKSAPVRECVISRVQTSSGAKPFVLAGKVASGIAEVGSLFLQLSMSTKRAQDWGGLALHVKLLGKLSRSGRLEDDVRASL